MSSSRTTTILTIAGVTAVGGLLAYAIYFDYKRRTDTNFRRKLRKEKKRIDKVKVPASVNAEVTIEEIRAALETVKNEEPPASVEERENYFMSHIGVGEQLSHQGPAYRVPAALAFYKALRVYPSPIELIVVLQKTVPEPVFKLLMEMTNLDVSELDSPTGRGSMSSARVDEDEISSSQQGPPSESSSQEWDKVRERIEGYPDFFPPKSMNVSTKSVIVPDGTGGEMRKSVLVSKAAFKAGSVIFKEQPVSTALDFDLQQKGSHCSNCLRDIQKGMAIKPDKDRLGSVYCSKDCQMKANIRFQNLLFGLDPTLPTGVGPEPSSEDIQMRDAAQTAYVDYIKNIAGNISLLVARFIARQIAIETTKVMPSSHGWDLVGYDIPKADGGDYTLFDHVERLRYLELPVKEEEAGLLREVLQNALPGLENFITDERHTVLHGKVAYNAYGVCFGGGRDDRPASPESPELQERTRTPYGTSRQVGSAFYLVSSYLQHSCDPSARPSFSNGTAELHLIATRDIEVGDELTVAYVDVKPHADETVADCRRRRRMELAQGWRFSCNCSRCQEESKGIASAEEDKNMPTMDESKIDASLAHIERAQARSD